MDATESQPIETAPKDGTRIMLYDPNAYGWEIGHWKTFTTWGGKERGCWTTGHSCADAGDITIDYPTHWRPLPEIPA